MRRFWIVLLAVATAIAVGLPAGASPPKCVEDPTLPGCGAEVDDDPLAGTTCAEFGEWGDPVTGDFDITLSGKRGMFPDSACVDVMAVEGSWTVDVELTSGTVRSLLLVPRDSVAPGDSCGGYGFRNDIPGTVVLPGPDHPSDIDGDEMIEGSYVNSCGLDFAELVDGVYYDTVEPDIPSPLAFQVFMSGSNDAEVTLHVDLP